MDSRVDTKYSHCIDLTKHKLEAPSGWSNNPDHLYIHENFGKRIMGNDYGEPKPVLTNCQGTYLFARTRTSDNKDDYFLWNEVSGELRKVMDEDLTLTEIVKMVERSLMTLELETVE